MNSTIAPDHGFDPIQHIAGLDIADPGDGPARGRGRSRRGYRGNQRGGHRGRGEYRPNSPPRQLLDQPPGSPRGSRRMRGGVNRKVSDHGEVSETTLTNGSSIIRPAHLDTHHEPEDTISTPITPMMEHEDSIDQDLCFICASPVIYNSIAPCGHRTCHLCSMRLRALYKQKNCPHCRREADYVIFSSDSGRLFQDFSPRDIIRIDENLGIKFESDDIYEDAVDTLRFNCPSRECDYVAKGWYDLKGHVRRVHDRFLCDLCVKYKKVFAHEQSLFTNAELRRHESRGDDQPGAVDQSGFRGHPKCDFENERFFDDDALYQHCRTEHERCHICDRRAQGGNTHYYQNYDTLEQHFRQDHFLCPDSECLEKKFVVFESEIDLKGHQLEAHPAGLSKDARREARRIDLSDFDFRSPATEDARGVGRGGRGGARRGRGRNPDVDRAIPISTAQNLSRAELAFQRIQALENARPSTVSSTETFAARPRASAPSHPTTQAVNVPNNGFPALVAPTPSPHPANPTPQEQARRLHHAAVISRANAALDNDPPKVLRFRQLISSYNQSTISASNLIESFVLLFDPSSETSHAALTGLGKLVNELVDLFESEGKKKALLSSWNDWKAMNLDYPTLNPSSSSSTSRRGGMRILKLKSATANSAASVLGSGRAAAVTRPRVAPWAQALGNGLSAASLRTATNRPATATRSAMHPAVKSAPGTAEAFPALPEGTGNRIPPYVKAGRGGVVNAWAVQRPAGTVGAGVAVAGSAAAGETGASEVVAHVTGQGKKRGKQKETLMKWG